MPFALPSRVNSKIIEMPYSWIVRRTPAPWMSMSSFATRMTACSGPKLGGTVARPLPYAAVGLLCWASQPHLDRPLMGPAVSHPRNQAVGGPFEGQPKTQIRRGTACTGGDAMRGQLASRAERGASSVGAAKQTATKAPRPSEAGFDKAITERRAEANRRARSRNSMAERRRKFTR